MKNIKFEYLYRDAGNYKVFGNVIFPNPEKISVSEIETKLKNFEFFDPKDISIPCLRHSDFPYNQELDQMWNEYESVEETSEFPTDNRSISVFIQELIKVQKF